jgi:hypothetical protein
MLVKVQRITKGKREKEMMCKTCKKARVSKNPLIQFCHNNKGHRNKKRRREFETVAKKNSKVNKVKRRGISSKKHKACYTAPGGKIRLVSRRNPTK